MGGVSHPVEVQVAKDAEEPGSEVGSRVETPACGQRTDDCLLCEICCVLLVPGEGVGEPDQARLKGCDVVGQVLAWGFRLRHLVTVGRELGRVET